MPREQLRGDRSDVTDAERCEQSRQRLRLRRLDRGEQRIRAFLGVSLEPEQLAAGRAIEIGGIVHQPASISCSMRAYDKPRMSIAPREAKCTSPSSCRPGTRRSGSRSRPLPRRARQAFRTTDTSSAYATAVPRGSLFSGTGPMICGITSPARFTCTMSPMRRSFLRIRSSVVQRRELHDRLRRSPPARAPRTD